MAPISVEQLVDRLTKGKPVSAILLLGTDSYLREMTRQRIIDVSVDPGAHEWGLARFSAHDDELAHVLGQARTVPMLAARQVVVLSELEEIEHLRDNARDAAIADLTDYLNDPSPFTVLVLEADALDQRMKLSKLLLEKAVVVAAELPADAGERLRMAAELAVQMARERGSVIEPDAAEELADLCNCNLSALRSEVEKLATYAGKSQPIRRADVNELVISEKKYSVWELADILASRQRTRALLFLDNLLREGEQPPALVGAMAWMFRKLLEAQDLSPNMNSYQAAGKLQMRPATAEMAIRQARKIPRQQLVNGLRALYDADSRLKSSGSDNDRAVLEFLVAGLTNVGPAVAK
jgi:DNA polymerase III subunit delta